MAARTLDADRYFSSDPTVRRIARDIYERTRTLPLVSPHGHVDPALLAENNAFPEPTALLVTPDHYILRMLCSQGVPLEALGIPSRDGTVVEPDPRKVWQLFASNAHLFLGTPTGCWLDHQLSEVFGIRTRLSEATGRHIYDELSEKLCSPEFRPRALFARFNIEVLATTDAATDDLAAHRSIRASGWKGRVIPTFRPDALFRIGNRAWHEELRKLEVAVGRSVTSFGAFLQALSDRRRYFASLGATATDHGVVEPYTHRLGEHAAEALFARALQGVANADDQRAFEAHLLIEMARMSTEDGLVMQLHAGALRDRGVARAVS